MLIAAAVQVCPGDIELALPELLRLQMECVQMEGSCDAFGSSLSACPRLQVLSTYKFWGYLVDVYEMDLPCCREFSLMRYALGRGHNEHLWSAEPRQPVHGGAQQAFAPALRHT